LAQSAQLDAALLPRIEGQQVVLSAVSVGPFIHRPFVRPSVPYPSPIRSLYPSPINLYIGPFIHRPLGPFIHRPLGPFIHRPLGPFIHRRVRR